MVRAKKRTRVFTLENILLFGYGGRVVVMLYIGLQRAYIPNLYLYIRESIKDRGKKTDSKSFF
jgi:hypothetical protein